MIEAIAFAVGGLIALTGGAYLHQWVYLKLWEYEQRRRGR